jgi:hypothetical protein
MRRNGLLGCHNVKCFELAAEWTPCIDAAEHDLGVGQSRVAVALAVTRRPRSNPLSGPTPAGRRDQPR